MPRRPYPSEESHQADALKVVRENLENARQNSHSFVGLSAEQIADDMQRYCPDVERWQRDLLVKAIALVLSERMQ